MGTDVVKWMALGVTPWLACYPGVDNSDCAIRCGKADACPSDLSCVETFCVAEGQVCQQSPLVLAFSFDEFGATVHDDSGNGNNAMVHGTPGLVDAAHGKGMSFDGSTDYCRVPHAPSLAVASGGEFTVELWMLIEPQAPFMTDQVIVGKTWNEDQIASPFYEFGLEFDQQTGTIELLLGDEDENLHGNFRVTPPLGELFHVAFTYDGETVRAYLGGESQQLTNPDLRIVIPDRGKSLVIGTQIVPEEYLRGTIDDLRIYNRALRPDEIATDMNTPVVAAR